MPAANLYRHRYRIVDSQEQNVGELWRIQGANGKAFYKASFFSGAKGKAYFYLSQAKKDLAKIGCRMRV